MTVYVIQSDCGRIKVGYTEATTADDRLRTMQTGSPRKLTCLASFPGSIATERMIHGALDRDRVHGEWFRDGDGVRSLLSFVEHFGDAEGFALAHHRPDEWAEYVAEHGREADMEPLVANIRWRDSWREKMSRAAKKIEPFTDEEIEYEWRCSIGENGLPLAEEHVVAEFTNTDYVNWICDGGCSRGSGVHQTARLLKEMPANHGCWPWLGAIVHDATRSRDLDDQLARRVARGGALIAHIRRKTGGRWHKLSAALPERLEIPRNCYLTTREFVRLCARHARLISFTSTLQYVWAYGSRCYVQDRSARAA